ncbi:hypothetical protein MRB53_041505 [Persea americana]|nr:hypothetical protein MRB53_041505 [Persea americana]
MNVQHKATVAPAHGICTKLQDSVTTTSASAVPNADPPISYLNRTLYCMRRRFRSGESILHIVIELWECVLRELGM